MLRLDHCPDCGAPSTAHTGTYCNLCGGVLIVPDNPTDPNPARSARKPGDAAERVEGDMPERRAIPASRIPALCAAQDWRCAMPCGTKGQGRRLLPGERIAYTSDGTGIVHLECAMIGTVPLAGNPHVNDPFVAHGDGS
jgi:hypothetical protein